MQICLYGAASNTISPEYITAIEALGREMGKRGHTLVFGAGYNGLMGAAARGVRESGGKMIGVIPTFFREESVEQIDFLCNTLIYTDSMRERKQKMEELADAFITVPGGIGTFEEFFETLTLRQLGRHAKPIAIYNVNHYYDPMLAMMDHAIAQNFLREDCRTLYRVFDRAEEMLDALEQAPSDRPENRRVLKDG